MLLFATSKHSPTCGVRLGEQLRRHGGAEIAQTGPVMQSHNYTGVLAILSQ